jgi:lysophospholipase L1-like esterase
MKSWMKTVTRRGLLLPVLCVLACVPAHVAASEPGPGFALRDGDRVVFYGDSITQDGGYARLVEAYVATRFPEWDVRFYNAGVGGDTVAGGWAGTVDLRLERDVVAAEPTVVTVMLGMNDGRYRRYDPPTFAAYAEGFEALVVRLKKALPSARLTLIQPSPFDDITRPPQFLPGYDDVLRRFGCYLGALGPRLGAAVADFRGPVNAGLRALQQEGPVLARMLVPDRVHPSAAGHLVMGAALLRAWNAPSLVTRVVIDAAAARVVASEGTELADLVATDAEASWTQLDRALPLPLDFDDGDVALAEMAGAGLEKLDQQPLAVAGLQPGRYELTIDAQVVATFTADELREGVNLARYPTPMRQQARPVRWGAESRHELQRVRRQLLVAVERQPELAEVAEALRLQDEQAQRSRRETVRPQPHRYQVRRLPY